MTSRQIAPSGGTIDVCWHHGRICVAWQGGPGPDARMVYQEIDAAQPTLPVLLSLSWHLGSDVGAFPRLLSAHDSVWLIYRNGASLGGRAILRRDGQEVWRSPVACGGNDPVCLGVQGARGAMFAWQRAGDNQILSGRCLTPEGQFPEGFGRPTGLSHIPVSGVVVLVDDARGLVHGMTRPSWAGDLVAGEHPDAGALVRAGDGRELLAFAAQEAFTPRLAYDAITRTYAVVTWGRQGVRLATFTEADLVTPAPAPVPVWDATGTVVDCARFFRLDVATVPREASDGQCWQAHTVLCDDVMFAETEIFIVKGADPRFVEILRVTDDDVRLAYDATDSRYPRAWRLDVVGDGRSDALWCPSIGRVGDTRAFPTARLIRRAENGPSTSEPFPYLVGIEAHGRHIDYGGDVGVVDAVLVTTFTPHVGKTADGYHERHHWAVRSGRAIGLVRYVEIRDGKVAREFTFNRHAPVRSVPLSSLIVHPIADPPADVPSPEPEPDPMPTLPTHLTLRSAHGRYLCAESGGGTFVVADREAAREWETWRVMPGHTPTTVALQASDGHYLCAHEGGGSYVVADRQSVGPWESWRVERHGDGIALRADTSGLYLCAEYGGSVTVTRTEANAWEIWTPAKVDVSGPSVPTPEPGEPIVSRMVGRLQVWPDERAFSDDNGPYLPVLCHAGDLLSRWTRDPAGARALMADISAAGYDGVRTWTVLHGDYWRGREVGPMHQADYWSQVLSFAAALRTSGLRWLVSQGDMLRAITRQSERRMFMQSLAGSLDADMVLGVDAGNEALWNGETDPARLREAVDAFRSVQPCAVWSLTSPYGEDATELNAHAGSVYDVHGYRDGRSWDKIRHIFSLAYEVQPQRRLGLQSEPFGFGSRVSVTDHKHELTSDVMTLACAVSLMCRQAWVWFSGPGVMSDEAERMQDMPGFRASPAVRDWLPRDLMTFTSLVHGGASQRGRRVFAVPGVDETRADHAFCDDGRFVAAIYGPRWREVTQERAADITQTLDLGDAGRLVRGVRR